MAIAIDFHVHPATREATEALAGPPEQTTDFFHGAVTLVSIDETAAQYRQLGLVAVLLGIDAETTTGIPAVSNDYVADAVRRHPDVFVGFASVDPWKGTLAVEELERAVVELGLRGLKLHPGRQEFFPDDPRFAPLFARCAALGIPVLFHTGMMAAGAGTRGGGGLRLKYTRPVPHLDDLAATFPDLTIIGAHPSWPWQEEMLSVAMHKANVYIDLSGWSPKYFSPSLIQYANTLLQDKVLFGSDFPVINPERWLKDFAEAPFRDEVRPKIMIENAKKLLGLGA
jgi:uncharacterized protein